MRALGYRPNPVARALVTGRSQTLGVVSFDTTLYGPASTLFGIERAAHAAGLLRQHRQPARRSTATSVLDAVERLRGQGVDGMLADHAAASARRRRSRNLPAGAAGRGGGGRAGGTVPVVAVDQWPARRPRRGTCSSSVIARSGTSRGRRTSSRPSSAWTGWRADARGGGRRARRRCSSGDWSPRSGYELGRRLTESRDVTAVFVANDQMALGVLRALHEQGREIPREVSVVGFDDIPEAQYFTPPLTTVRQDFAEVGPAACGCCSRRSVAAADVAPQQLTVAPELVVRRSTAPPPAGR